jgi:hypothetical protein
MPAYPPRFSILPNNLAGANFGIESRVIEFLLLSICSASPNMPWQAKPGCVEHHRAACEVRACV